MNPISAEERVRRARSAQQAWAQFTVARRASLLRNLRLHIAAARNDLVQVLVRETGKPPLDALAGDVLVTLEHMRYYERNAAKVLRKRKVPGSWILCGSGRFHESQEPYGVALVFAPANYPLQLSLLPAVTALYAGNAVILKCSERTAELARRIEQLCRSSALPADLLQVVSDEGAASCAYIDAQPDIVFFTGSVQNGRTVTARAARFLIPTVMELGGSDAALVFADCDVERTIEGIVYGAFANAGQVCVGVKRLYVQNSIYPEFLEMLKHRIAQLRIGTGLECDLGNLPSDASRTYLAAQVEDALSRGARIEYPQPQPADLHGPMLLSDVPQEAKLVQEGSFGPVLSIASFKSEEHAIQLANASPFALGASVWTRDMKRAERVSSRLRAGACSVNDVIRNIANPHAAFGGNGLSGYGRYHGPAGLLAFSRSKSVMVTNSRRRRERNWFPLTRVAFEGLNKLIELRHRPRGVLAALRSLVALACCSILLQFAAVAQQPPAHLRLKVSLPKPVKGEVAYLVFASSDGFPQNRTKAVRHGFVPANGETVEIDAGPLAPGRYAVSVYLDENGNHKLDSGFLGIPKEPVGVSRNPRPKFGPPRFDDCEFAMGTADETVGIRVVRAR